MPRTALWESIAATLAEEIGRGDYRAGDRLPSEAELAARFGVNRHTLRRSLAHLAARGLIRSRRGAGAFVAERPVDHALGRRLRYDCTLAEAGQVPGRSYSRLETRRANPGEAEALGLAEGEAVHVAEGIGFADGVPIALFCSVFPAARLPGLIAALAELGTVTDALARVGVRDVTRASIRLTAETASPVQAAQLRLEPGAALLRTVSVTVDPAGVPVEWGHAWFAGERVTLTLGAE